MISKFPHFFDSHSVSYILDQAKNNINESELMGELKETKDSAREQKMRMMENEDERNYEGVIKTKEELMEET